MGCIVNGAGLAMGTMDAIVLHGGRPANFLDVGGGASPEKVANAFRIVLQDPNVRAILVNIFAGINRCDWIAQGVVQATRDQAIGVPVIVRLAGTNVEAGRAILDGSGLDLIQAEDLDDARGQGRGGRRGRGLRRAGGRGAGMSVFVHKDSRVIIQGFTGQHATFHAEEAIQLGTQVVGGVTPGKGGTTHLGLPVFNSVAEAVEETGANVSGIFVPPQLATDSLLEAAEAGIQTAVIIADGVPVQDMVRTKRYLAGRQTMIIGPNSPGIITPGECKVGIMPSHIYSKGRIGVVSRSGTLNYEAVSQMTKLGLGQSTCVGIGGDPVNGTDFRTVMQAFEGDDDTDVGRHDRRDRGPAGGRGGPLGGAVHVEAGGGVRGRCLGAPRAAHGPRGRGDRRRLGHGDGQARRDRGAGAPHGAQPRRHRRHGPPSAEGGGRARGDGAGGLGGGPGLVAALPTLDGSRSRA